MSAPRLRRVVATITWEMDDGTSTSEQMDVEGAISKRRHMRAMPSKPGESEPSGAETWTVTGNRLR